ncbi:MULTISPECIES: cytosine permease [Clostridia]|uniref:purine-cytosine permease family protein n=1 Tax=Clostridia TaxID=186801 RepID=UPI000EA2FAEB|nr:MULTISPECIES: cytosine permease [Clostridia]NBJ71069.1 allantoin permease [Roseburia sp. 1XD42-34]RKI75351.1 allantoin permease [Clostridium sp. 1xD42-85]
MAENKNKITVSAEERVGKPKDLFFIWFAANIGILGVVYGAMIVGFQLSFIQSTLAALIAALSFILVGYISVIGKKNGITTFMLSRAAFGTKGNWIPNFLGWLNLVGWLSVNVVTGTLILLSLATIFHIDQNSTITLICLLIFATFVLLSGLLNQQQLAKLQTFFTYVFGGLTLIILVILIPQTDFQQLFSMPNGSWLEGFLPAVSIIMAGTGISWSIAGADYSAYQVPTNKNNAIMFSVLFGAFIPLFVIMFVGILLSTSLPNIATSANPIDVIAHALPSWISIIYFITAVGGLIPQCIISLKSARVNLETLNIQISNRGSLIVHGTIMILIPVYVLFISQDFLYNFQLFLGLLGIGIASWAAVFVADYYFNRKSGYDLKLLEPKGTHYFNKTGIISWFIGVIIGFLFTNTDFFSGPFAVGVFRDNSLGLLLAFISGYIAYVLIHPFMSDRRGK